MEVCVAMMQIVAGSPCGCAAPPVQLGPRLRHIERSSGRENCLASCEIVRVEGAAKVLLTQADLLLDGCRVWVSPKLGRQSFEGSAQVLALLETRWGDGHHHLHHVGVSCAWSLGCCARCWRGGRLRSGCLQGQLTTLCKDLPLALGLGQVNTDRRVHGQNFPTCREIACLEHAVILVLGVANHVLQHGLVS